MAIRVVTVANPAAGTDWKFTVPGQWRAQLVGVKAVLNTGGSLSTLPDETAVANDLTVFQNQSHYTQGVTGPFTGGANNYAIGCDGNTPGDSRYAQGVAGPTYGGAAISFDWWERITSIANGSSRDAFSLVVNATTEYFGCMIVGAVAGTQYHKIVNFGGALHTTNDPNHAIGGWHHHGVVMDGVNILTYLDGALTGTLALVPPGASTTSRPTAPGGINGPGVGGDLAGVAVYGVALTGVQVAAHAAASGSASAYRTAVLADAPQGLWMLSGVRPGPSRAVDLQITDGTNLVAEYPSNFAATTAPSFTWSWQVLGPSALSTTDGSTNTVPIPSLTLPAGYTIGTRTLGLAGTDQWSQITLWFDDGTGSVPGQGGTVTEDAYLDVLLLPDYWKP